MLYNIMMSSGEYATMEEWSKALDLSERDSDRILAGLLNVTREKRDNQLHELGLPTTRSITLEPPFILEDKLKLLATSTYWLDLTFPKNPRERFIDITALDISNQITRHPDAKRIVIKEFWPNTISFNLIISPLGNETQTVMGEMAKGNHSELVAGHVTPEWIITSHPTGRISCIERKSGKAVDENYNPLANPERDHHMRIREAVQNVLKTIPRDGRDFMPGYYEGIVTTGSRPIFIEYQQNRAMIN